MRPSTNYGVVDETDKPASLITVPTRRDVSHLCHPFGRGGITLCDIVTIDLAPRVTVTQVNRWVWRLNYCTGGLSLSYSWVIGRNRAERKARRWCSRMATRQGYEAKSVTIQ